MYNLKCAHFVEIVISMIIKTLKDTWLSKVNAHNWWNQCKSLGHHATINYYLHKWNVSRYTPQSRRGVYVAVQNNLWTTCHVINQWLGEAVGIAVQWVCYAIINKETSWSLNTNNTVPWRELGARVLVISTHVPLLHKECIMVYTSD